VTSFTLKENGRQHKEARVFLNFKNNIYFLKLF
jgi:hypothetical protein